MRIVLTVVVLLLWIGMGTTLYFKREGPIQLSTPAFIIDNQQCRHCQDHCNITVEYNNGSLVNASLAVPTCCSDCCTDQMLENISLWLLDPTILVCNQTFQPIWSLMNTLSTVFGLLALFGTLITTCLWFVQRDDRADHYSPLDETL